MVSNHTSDLVYCNEHGHLIHRDNVKLLEVNQREHDIRQAGIGEKKDWVKQLPDNVQRNMKMAAVYNQATDNEVLDTIIGFMDGSISMEYLPMSLFESEGRSKDIKQAAIKANREKPEVMLQTFMEFGGL